MPWTYEHLKPKGKPDLLSDEVPWRAMIAPGVVLQKKDYALQRSYLVRAWTSPTRVTRSREPPCCKPMKCSSAWAGNGCSE